MKTKLIAAIILLFTFISIEAQEIKSDGFENQKIRKNTLHLEIGGNGILSSINYERQLRLNDRSGLVFRGGLGVYGENKLVEGSDPEVDKLQMEYSPIFELNYLYGAGPNRFMEIGIGNCIFHSVTFRIGYRYQSNNGFLFRAGAVVVTGGEWWIPVWPGLSFGYSF